MTFRVERPAISLLELNTAYRMALHASGNLKLRVLALGPEQRPAFREISRYQQLIARYGEAVKQTFDMAQHGDAGDTTVAVRGDSR